MLLLVPQNWRAAQSSFMRVRVAVFISFVTFSVCLCSWTIHLEIGFRDSSMALPSFIYNLHCKAFFFTWGVCMWNTFCSIIFVFYFVSLSFSQSALPETKIFLFTSTLSDLLLLEYEFCLSFTLCCFTFSQYVVRWLIPTHSWIQFGFCGCRCIEFIAYSCYWSDSSDCI